MDVACLTVLGCNLWICSTHPGARCQQSLMLKSHRPWGQISISTSCLHILFTSAYIVYHINIYIYNVYIWNRAPYMTYIVYICIHSISYIIYHISYIYNVYIYIHMFCMRYYLHAIYYMSIPMIYESMTWPTLPRTTTTAVLPQGTAPHSRRAPSRHAASQSATTPTFQTPSGHWMDTDGMGREYG